jgi:hypothetical protein
MTIIINPGTEPQAAHCVENAIKTAEHICSHLGIEPSHFSRDASADDGDGWYGFRFTGKGGTAQVKIPGIGPETVIKGEPWVSPRLYVNGSSWLYGFALDRIWETIAKAEA